jgi:hypothetical protein
LVFFDGGDGVFVHIVPIQSQSGIGFDALFIDRHRVVGGGA